jgi:polysaccharide pyruvyl transferase WcaK-like protein
MSLSLFLARWLLGKRVYLLGVGYYNSTNRLGRISARLAAWGSTAIVARDDEAYTNFRRFSRRVYQDHDLAYLIEPSDLAPYQSDLTELNARITPPPSSPAGQRSTIFIAFRRFHGEDWQRYRRCIRQLVDAFPEHHFIIATLEPRSVDHQGYQAALRLQATHINVTAFDLAHNPLAFFAWLHQHHQQLIMIAPQFHALVAAHLNHIPLFPMAYDNKVSELLKQLGYKHITSFYEVNFEDLRDFLNQTLTTPRHAISV